MIQLFAKLSTIGRY